MVNEKETYFLRDKKTKKIVEYFGKLQYYRLKQRAIIEKEKVQNDLGIEIEVIRNKPTRGGPFKNGKEERN